MQTYTLNSNKLTFAEAWRIGGLILWLARLFRAPIASTTVILGDSSGVEEIPFGDFPQAQREILEPALKEAEALGFQQRLTFSLWSPQPENSLYSCLLGKPGFHSLLPITAVKKGPQLSLQTEVSSELADGREILHTTSTKNFDKPNWMETHYYKTITLKALWDAHQKRIESQQLRPVPGEKEALLTEVRKNHDRWVEYGVNRGFLVPRQSGVA